MYIFKNSLYSWASSRQYDYIVQQKARKPCSNYIFLDTNTGVLVNILSWYLANIHFFWYIYCLLQSINQTINDYVSLISKNAYTKFVNVRSPWPGFQIKKVAIFSQIVRVIKQISGIIGIGKTDKINSALTKQIANNSLSIHISIIKDKRLNR